MKYILMITLLATNIAVAEIISGVVKVKGKAPKGTLFIFAKKFNSKMPMPLAVKRIPNPKFPLKFILSKKDAMMKQIPFIGPFKVTARISPSGNAMDKSGLEVSTSKEIKLGDQNIELMLGE